MALAALALLGGFVGNLLAVLSLVEEPVPRAGRVTTLHLLPFGQRSVLESLQLEVALEMIHGHHANLTGKVTLHPAVDLRHPPFQLPL